MFVDGTDSCNQTRIKKSLDARTKLLCGLLCGASHIRFKGTTPRFASRAALGVKRRQRRCRSLSSFRNHYVDLRLKLTPEFVYRVAGGGMQKRPSLCGPSF